MIFYFAIQFVNIMIQALVAIIILYAVFSFFVPRGSDNPIMRFLASIAEPLLEPLRRVLPTMGMLDLSPLVAILLLQYVLGPLLIYVLVSAARVTS